MYHFFTSSIQFDLYGTTRQNLYTQETAVKRSGLFSRSKSKEKN